MCEWEIRPVTVAAAAQVWRLHVTAGWCAPEAETPEWVEKSIRNSLIFLGAFAGEELIGMARAVSDAVSDAYIQDVAVAPEWRRRGIGGALVHAVRRHLEQRGIDWIGLVATPGQAGFYQALGFEVMDGYTPMLYKRR